MPATNSPASPRPSAILALDRIHDARVRLQGIAEHTPLQHHLPLSEEYECEIWLKREDLQKVRSFKIRGAYNMMASLSKKELEKGVVCASAGNHAQGVAFACRQMGVKGRIFMPGVTPQQKIGKVKLFGKEYVEIILVGDTFDDAQEAALREVMAEGTTYIPPFDDERIMEGQATIALEILESCGEPIDYLFACVGGGGLIAGLGSVFKAISPHTRIVGVEPSGAPAMYESLQAGKVITLPTIDPFVDGAAVQRVGEKTFRIAKEVIDEMELVPEGKVCSTILKLYNEDGIVVEPAGALTIAVLDQYREQIKGKNVVCIVSGSNNDITRTQEIRDRSLLYEGLKHFFIIRFPQRAGSLREFLNNVLGPNDDITHFEYTKKHNRANGPALVGIQLEDRNDYENLLARMKANRISYVTLNDSPELFDLVV